jgi:hypothetical protein
LGLLIIGFTLVEYFYLTARRRPPADI